MILYFLMLLTAIDNQASVSAASSGTSALQSPVSPTIGNISFPAIDSEKIELNEFDIIESSPHNPHEIGSGRFNDSPVPDQSLWDRICLTGMDAQLSFNYICELIQDKLSIPDQHTLYCRFLINRPSQEQGQGHFEAMRYLINNNLISIMFDWDKQARITSWLNSAIEYAVRSADPEDLHTILRTIQSHPQLKPHLTQSSKIQIIEHLTKTTQKHQKKLEQQIIDRIKFLQNINDLSKIVSDDITPNFSCNTDALKNRVSQAVNTLLAQTQSTQPKKLTKIQKVKTL